jgi:hypothetical protein
MIETKEFYDSYLQDSSSRNLMRFNVKQLDTRSNGCLYFFDYKTDYKYDVGSDGSITNYGEEKTLYNSTRIGTGGNDGKNQDQILFKRPIIEVKPNYKTGRIEIHAIVIGAKHHPSNKEIGYHETFSGESVVKFGDVFVCSGAAKSHSSVIEPRVYIFDPNTRQIQRVCNQEVNTTSLISVPDHGAVIGASYGEDSKGNPTPVNIVSMVPGKTSGFINTTGFNVDDEGDPHFDNHRLEDVGHPVAPTDAATRGYVDSINLPVYNYASKQIEELQDGQFVCFKGKAEITTELGWIRAIVWKGVDANGNRPMRDAGAVDWEGNLNSAFSLLIENGNKLIFKASMSQVVNGHAKISYLADFDAYCVEWTGGDTSTITSDFIKMTNSQTVSFHCPELFF